MMKNLKKIRTQHNMTQKEVAELLGYKSERAYRSFENGQSPAINDKLITIANYFDVSIDYLLGRTDNPNINK